MGKYFWVQVKRIGRVIPLAVLASVILFAGIYLAYQALVSHWEQDESFRKLQIGIVGTADDHLMQMAVDAVKTMDSSHLSVTFAEMGEQQAISRLERGEISAYLVFPEGFLERAMQGEILPIRFVSAAAGENVLSLIKDEFAGVFANMLLSSEKGAYALDIALQEYGYDNISREKMNELAIAYAQKVFHRDEVYVVEELGISGGLSFSSYMICGLSVLFLCLATLAFAPLLILQDDSLQRVLKCRGVGAVQQVLCEFGVYVLALIVLAVFPAAISGKNFFVMLFGIIPVAICIAGISYLVYSVCVDLLSGVLLQLLLSLAMCFLSGCMYPVHFFPVAVQKLSAWLPAAIARNYWADLLWEAAAGSGWLLLGIGLFAVGASIGIRHLRIAGRKEAAL